MRIVKYGILPNGEMIEEIRLYAKAGETVVSEADPRLVALPGESGMWLPCCVFHEFPAGITLSDKATYDAHIEAQMEQE